MYYLHDLIPCPEDTSSDDSTDESTDNYGATGSNYSDNITMNSDDSDHNANLAFI
jgi:hypothetical protein